MICMFRHTYDVVIYSKFHRNLFRGFGAPGVKIFPFPLLWLLAFTTAHTTIQAVMMMLVRTVMLFMQWQIRIKCRWHLAMIDVQCFNYLQLLKDKECAEMRHIELFCAHDDLLFCTFCFSVVTWNLCLNWQSENIVTDDSRDDITGICKLLVPFDLSCVICNLNSFGCKDPVKCGHI